MSDRQTTTSEPEPQTPPQVAPVAPPPAQKPPRRHTPVRRSDAWFMLVVLMLGTLSVVTLSHISDIIQQPHRAASSTATTPASATRTSQAAPRATPAGTAIAPGKTTVKNAQEYPYSPSVLANAGVMYASVDAQGNIWTGAMELNKLVRFNPKTGKITSWTPPNGQYNIMDTTFDTQGNLWFTEQVANYIGRFDPTTQTFKTYPLGKVNGQNASPQDLLIDKQGNIWFTELLGGAIGRLDPATGAIKTWNAPAPNGQKTSYPYCLAMGPDGRIWFGYLAGGAVGVLDPTSGKVSVSLLSDPKDEVFSMASDANGNVWFSVLDAPVLGHIDAKTGAIAEHTVPAAAGTPTNLYTVITAKDGTVWFDSAGADSIVHYVPSSDAFTFYKLSTAQSIPYGLAFGPDGNLWYTADGTPNYIGMIKP